MSRLDKIVEGLAASGVLSKAEKAAKATASKAEKKRRKQERSAAVAAQNWDDREGKARPTPERRSKGAFALHDGEDAGVTVAVDEVPDCLAALLASGAITKRQHDGGRAFAEAAFQNLGGPSQRSCLDIGAAGYDASDGDPDQHREWRRLQRYTGGAFGICLTVCWEGLAIKPHALGLLRHGLTQAADWAGLPNNI